MKNLAETSPKARKPFTVAAIAAFTVAAVLALAGCTMSKPSSFAEATIDGGNVVIPKAQIDKQATYINYDADGTTVQLLAVQSTDGEPHVALNTCQSCNPSPKAFFKQDGSKLTCNNCGLEFSVDTVGATNSSSSCNPAPIQGLSETDDAFVVPVSMLDAYAPFFEKWRGPTK